MGERGFGVPTKFFCSSYIYGRCWSRIRMMPSWHPWGNWVICKLGWPLPKFHFWVITLLLYKINERLWCLHLGFHGQWIWLDHCREDPEICICIIMLIRSAITEIASVCPNSFITQGKSTVVVSIYSIIKSVSPSASAQSSSSSSEALCLSILCGFRQFGPPRHAQKKVHGNCPELHPHLRTTGFISRTATAKQL